MKARINKTPDFDKNYVEQAIANGLDLNDIAEEFKTTTEYVIKRVFDLFDANGMSKLKMLDDNASKKPAASPKHAKASEATKNAESLAANVMDGIKPLGISRSDSISLYDTVSKYRYYVEDEPIPKVESDPESDDTEDLMDLLSKNLYDGLEYALGQLEADKAVGDDFAETDTTVTRAAIKKLQSDIEAAEKDVSDARTRQTEWEVKKTELEERVERATEKLRRAKQDASHAVSELDSARGNFKRSKAKLEELRKQKEQMEKQLAEEVLPIFSIVPSGDYVVLQAVNYDARRVDSLEAALKWSRRIGEQFSDLSDSEFSVLGRLFGILSKLKGRYKVEIAPELTAVNEVYNHFKNCFK